MKKSNDILSNEKIDGQIGNDSDSNHDDSAERLYKNLRTSTARSKVIRDMPDVDPESLEPTKMVVGIIHNEKTHFLLLQRSVKAHFKDKFRWVFPHGRINEGESKEDALRRTVFEQLHAEIDIVKKLERKLYFYTKRQLYKPDQDRLVEYHVYICRLMSPEVERIYHKRLHWKRVHFFVDYPFDYGMIDFFYKTVEYVSANK